MEETDDRHISVSYEMKDGDKCGVKIFVSHGSKYKDPNDDLVGKVAGRVKLQKKEFEDLVSFTVKRAEYEEIIMKRLKTHLRSLKPPAPQNPCISTAYRPSPARS